MLPRLLLITALALDLIAGPGLAAPPGPTRGTTVELRGAAAPGGVLGMLLLIMSEEDAKLSVALDALYVSAYVSTAMDGRGDVEHYLTSVMAARYKGTSSKAVFAALVRYQALIARSFRHPRRASPTGLRSETAQIMSTLPRGQIEQFADRAHDWLALLQDSLSRSGELTMIQLQNLVSQRQLALQLAANLIAALNDATKQVASNIGTDPAPAESTKTTKGTGSSEPCLSCDHL